MSPSISPVHGLCVQVEKFNFRINIVRFGGIFFMHKSLFYHHPRTQQHVHHDRMRKAIPITFNIDEIVFHMNPSASIMCESSRCCSNGSSSGSHYCFCQTIVLLYLLSTPSKCRASRFLVYFCVSLVIFGSTTCFLFSSLHFRLISFADATHTHTHAMYTASNDEEQRRASLDREPEIHGSCVTKTYSGNH